MMLPVSNMYGTPYQAYATPGNGVVYPADGNGFIANVAQADVAALADQGALTLLVMSPPFGAHFSGDEYPVGMLGAIGRRPAPRIDQGGRRVGDDAFAGGFLVTLVVEPGR